LAARARSQQQVRDRRDGWQGFAAESERRNRREVFDTANLARRMPLERSASVLALHPFAVVFNPHPPLAAELDMDRNPARAGVDGVLDQLFHDGRRALDDFASGNLVGKM
jgi:hypothetical protein